MFDHTRVKNMTEEQARYIVDNHGSCSDLVCARKLQALEFLQNRARIAPETVVG